MHELRELVLLAAGYAMISLSALAIFAVLFLIGYFAIYKKILKGTKRIRISDMISWGLLIAYLAVILIITLDRGAVYGGYRGNITPPLYSYIEAWNNFSFTLWRNIILNIAAFIPLGFLLPLAVKKSRVFYKTYSLSFLFALSIEVLQLITGRGIFECDDLIGNTAGAMIGYGIFALLYSLHCKGFKKINRKRLALLQLPLIISIAVFASIFTAYSAQELGNLRYYVFRAPQSRYSVWNDGAALSDNEDVLPVFRVKSYTHSEAEDYAEALMKAMGDKINHDRTIFYEETGYFYSKKSALLLIKYDTGSVEYTDFDYIDVSRGNTDVTEKQARDTLKNMGVTVPENAVFTNQGDGWYLFDSEALQDDISISGSISFMMYKDIVVKYYNDIISLEPYGQYTIISPYEAYNQISQGRFYYSSQYSEYGKIIINDYHIEYDIDTKGFYQPVYVFDVIDNSHITTISLPAIKK